mgnify:CR=1 FL=1
MSQAPATSTPALAVSPQARIPCHFHMQAPCGPEYKVAPEWFGILASRGVLADAVDVAADGEPEDPATADGAGQTDDFASIDEGERCP